MPQFRLLEADRVEITTLVDNQIDALLPGDETVRRRPWGPSVHNDLIDATDVRTTLRAEHGFSALVTITRGERTHRLLFDAGVSPDGLIQNMDRMQLEAKDIEALVLSHGHFDHTGGIHGLVERLGRTSMPMVLHPDAYRQRRAAPPGVDPSPLPPPSRSAIEGAGFAIIEDVQPSLLLEESVLITGEVPRITDFERGFPFFQANLDGEWTPEPHLMDDQALVANIKGKGLLVLSGCGHSGIVNIVRQAQALTGITKIAGIMGGFHLTGTFFEPLVGPTVEALRGFEPGLVVPAHCTGYKPQMAIAAALPEAYVHNAVGTTCVF